MFYKNINNPYHHSVAHLKSILLSKATIKFSTGQGNRIYIQDGNLAKRDWIFIRLNNTSRVRLEYDENATLSLRTKPDGTYVITDDNESLIIAENVYIEKAIVHAPEQIFFALYRNCSMGCKFCPLSKRIDNPHYSLERIYARIKAINIDQVKSIGITSAYPQSLSARDIVDEIIFLIEKLKQLVGTSIPIGVSVKSPSKDDLLRLKECGVREVRLNVEIFNDELSKRLMPHKYNQDILQSIASACEIFGKNFVSSNMLVGVGESDEDLINGVEALAALGAVATLYPYDIVEGSFEQFARPSAGRLYNLSIAQKKMFDKYEIDPNNLLTMCCACAASHIFPGKDL